MTNLESLANLGEIIGAVAVVVSLIYLAVQVRQNTHAQQTENFSRALDRVAALDPVEVSVYGNIGYIVYGNSGLCYLSK